MNFFLNNNFWKEKKFNLKSIKKKRKNLQYFAVFDGHAGSRAAAYCAENMHKILAENFSKALEKSANNSIAQIEKEMKRHLVETFKQCDEEFLKIASKK